jgi:type I restriction-modification system DNA methylase subunit
MPPVNNANHAWIQHFIHHLSPLGVAGFVMANGSENVHSSPMKILENVRNTECQTGRGQQCLN